MTFLDAVKTCFTKYGDFKGRASRSEYWWYTLFIVLASFAAAIISDRVSALFALATLLPSIAVGARRLHDTNRSGWLQLIVLIPVLGWLVLLYFMLQEPKEPNRFGAAPLPDSQQSAA
jgi:uncharacterized membrane protein YhaH (DUF805 family)